ncbi:MAG: hypothetical protein KDK30_07565 [Leptospiraceae bacterium]|nr:hypothetical protein [Leptospiraceae bacterium]
MNIILQILFTALAISGLLGVWLLVQKLAASGSTDRFEAGTGDVADAAGQNNTECDQLALRGFTCAGCTCGRTIPELSGGRQ